MLLAIDAGNTNIVFSAMLGEEVIGVWRCQTLTGKTCDEYAVWLTHLLALKGLKPSDFRDCIISSVVPAATPQLKDLAKTHFGCHPLVVEENAILPIAVDVPDPKGVGGDRLVNAVAGWRLYGGPLILVDFGTATTMDMTGLDGAYVGGIIAPGINLSSEALYQAAARLPRVDFAQPQNVIGDATVPAMQSGLYWGYVGLVDGIVSRMKAEFKEKNGFQGEIKVIATGGLGQKISENSQEIDFYHGDLTIMGLRFIYEANKPTRH